MYQNDVNIALRDSLLGKFGLTTRHEKMAQEKSKVGANDALFTNQAILTSINNLQKNPKLKRISFKRPSFQENHNYCEFLKISSLAFKVENNQKQQDKQNLSNPIKIKNIEVHRYLGIRPKSAVCRSSGFTDFKNTKRCKQVTQSQAKQSQLVIQINKKISKQCIPKDKSTGKISLFTCNSNVFIPRTNNKYYASYLTKQKIDEIKLKSRQENSKQNQNKLQRNTVSNYNQKDIQDKCISILNLDCKASQKSAVTKSIKRKKIDYSQKHLQLVKLSNNQSTEILLKHSEAQEKAEKNNRNFSKSFSQLLDSEHCENLKNMYKTNQLSNKQTNQINKKQSTQLKSRNKLQPKYKAKSKKRECSLFKQQKMVQSYLCIQKVQFAAGHKNQKQYFRATCPDSGERKSINLLTKYDSQFKIQKKGQKELISTADCIDKPSRELCVHI